MYVGGVDVAGLSHRAVAVPFVHRLLTDGQDVPAEGHHLKVTHLVELVHRDADRRACNSGIRNQMKSSVIRKTGYAAKQKNPVFVAFGWLCIISRMLCTNIFCRKTELEQAT